MPSRNISPSINKGFPLPGALVDNSRLLDIQAVRDSLVSIDTHLNTLMSDVSIISTDTTANKNGIYVFISNLNLTLPLNPNKNDKVSFTNLTPTGSSVLIRNGSKIMGLDEDMIIDLPNSKETLVYCSADLGWVLV